MNDQSNVNHDAGHGPLLDQILASGTDAAAAFERSQLSTCEACRRELASTLQWEERLERVAQEETEALEEARVLGPTLGRAEQALARHVQGSSGGPSGRLLRWSPLLVAAAALVIWYVYPSRRVPHFDDLPLHESEGLVPVGAGASFHIFRWDVPSPPGAWYEVRVHEPDALGEPGPLLAESGALLDRQWTPGRGTTASWPQRIIWILEVRRGPMATQLIERFVSSAQR